MLVTCAVCQWQEQLPARRHIPGTLDHRAGVAFAARRTRSRAVHELLARIASASPGVFERFCASMFAAKGYEVTFADRMFDQSHALELRAGREKVYVACPPGRHRTSVEELERLAGAARHDDDARAICVTTGAFDDACLAFAATADVELLDGDALAARLVDVPIDQLRAWVAPTIESPGA